jgi:hypothetical protein
MRSYTKVHRNVYARTDVELTALDRAQAYSHRRIAQCDESVDLAS